MCKMKIALIVAQVSNHNNSNGQATALGGITNRNFLVSLGNEDFVVHLPGKNNKLLGISHRKKWVSSQIAAQLGVGAEIVSLAENDLFITRYIQGRTMEIQEISYPHILQQIVSIMHRYHGSHQIFPGKFSPFDSIKKYYSYALKYDVKFPYQMQSALKKIALIETLYEKTDYLVPCHNDLVTGNFIVGNDEKISIIDWEYAAMGDLYFDLGNLAANFKLNQAAIEKLVHTYFYPQVNCIDLQRVILMKLSSELRESLWGFLQEKISSLDLDFRQYGMQYLNIFLFNFNEARKLNQLCFAPNIRKNRYENSNE